MSVIEATRSTQPLAQRQTEIVKPVQVKPPELSPLPRPLVQISISSGGLGDRTAEARVNSLLSDVQEQNGRAYALSITDWDIVAKFIGSEAANAKKESFGARLQLSQDELIKRLDSSGIAIIRPDSPFVDQKTRIPGYITVSEFSFKEGSSTYRISPESNGALVGTKDGQPWKRWDAILDYTPTKSAADLAREILSSLTGGLTNAPNKLLSLNA